MLYVGWVAPLCRTGGNTHGIPCGGVSVIHVSTLFRHLLCACWEKSRLWVHVMAQGKEGVELLSVAKKKKKKEEKKERLDGCDAMLTKR